MKKVGCYSTLLFFDYVFSRIPDIEDIKEEIERIKKTEQYVEPDSKTIEARFESDLKNWPDFKKAIQEMGLESRGVGIG